MKRHALIRMSFIVFLTICICCSSIFPVIAQEAEDNTVLISEIQVEEDTETMPKTQVEEDTETMPKTQVEEDTETMPKTQVEEDTETMPKTQEEDNTASISEIQEEKIMPLLEEEKAVSRASAASREDDIATVTGEGIRFKLFNYSLDINKNEGKTTWRDRAKYFTFRGSGMETGAAPSDTVHIPEPNSNAEHDVDGFTAKHATVERVLGENGMPVLDLTRNADGTSRTDPGVSKQTRSLAHLFSNTGDFAVSAYSPANTILQKDGIHYWFDSADNAVDYDVTENLFRVRGYTERNSTTATYGAAYGDFIPFTYTEGTVLGETEDGISYHVDTKDVDYWFGMTMDVSFFQSENGIVDGKNMKFSFSGDDDVWVFLDDVLVLDLGGTHGTADGSIDFATGQVLQYLTWEGANGSEVDRTEGSSTSFPTTIRECFDRAGKTPNGGWSKDGKTFANYTGHTLKFFYLERGAAVANCSLDFVLPTLPDKSLTVTKDLKDAQNSEIRDYIKDTLSYQFRVVKTDESGNSTEELFIKPGTSYNLMEKGVKTGTGVTQEDGTFSLKAGQSAQFTDMLTKGDGARNYVVQEIMPDELTGQYGSVEYEVSGNGGVTIEKEGSAVGFTAYETGVLTAEQTQTVAFWNKVDTSVLGLLKIRKEMEPGSRFTKEEYFKISVKLGGSVLPAGTEYEVIGDGEETTEKRTVEEDGTISLRIGETATILKGILSGTEYEIEELEADENGYRVKYSRTVTSGTDNETQQAQDIGTDKVSGTFPLNSTVSVTVTNSDHDFAVNIPLRKEVFGLKENMSTEFHFLVDKVRKGEDETWKSEESLPGTVILVNGEEIADGEIVIGYTNGTEGIFYYRIREEEGDDNYIYDSTFYIVEIEVKDDQAQIRTVLKNGEESVSPTEPLHFLNRTVTEEPDYKLPDTGGRKTGMYTWGGLLFSMTAVFLLYKYERWRKEEKDS